MVTQILMNPDVSQKSRPNSRCVLLLIKSNSYQLRTLSVQIGIASLKHIRELQNRILLVVYY